MISTAELLGQLPLPDQRSRGRVVPLVSKPEPTPEATYKRKWIARPGNRERVREAQKAYAKKRYRADPEGAKARAAKWVAENRARARHIWRESKARRRRDDPEFAAKEAARVAAYKARKKAEREAAKS